MQKHTDIAMPVVVLVMCLETIILCLSPPGSLTANPFWMRSIAVAVILLAPFMAWVATEGFLDFIEGAIASGMCTATYKETARQETSDPPAS